MQRLSQKNVLLSIDGQIQVSHVHRVAVRACPEQKILRLDVAVQVVGIVQGLESMKKSIDLHQYGLERELAATVL